MTIAALVLAAGESRRYGSPKQLTTQDGEARVRRVARLAIESGCSPVRVVVGAHAERVSREVEDLEGAGTVHHPGWRAGMGSSIAAGIQTFYNEPSIRAVLLLACDQTALDRSVLRRIIAAFDGVPRRTVACSYSGTVGIPALFERAWFGRLAALTGDRGAKSLLLERPDLLVEIDWPEGAADLDRRHDPGP